MSASANTIASAGQLDLKVREILRYGLGSALIMGIAMGSGWMLSILTPVLALVFLGSPTPSPTLKQGLSFVYVIFIASFAGLIMARYLLPYPLVYIPLIGLIFLRIFYARPKQLSPFLKLFLMLALAATPFLALQSMAIASAFTMGMVINGLATVVLVWLVYGIFPDKWSSIAPAQQKKPPPAPTDQQRFITALISTIVVFPALILYYYFEWTNSLTILIYVMLLAMQPGFAKDFKAGGLMILANVAGGIAAIIAYELLVIVPRLSFMIMLVALFGLFFGSRLFSQRPAAALYGSAFSTFLLIVGMSTGGEADASSKVYSRIAQIMVAVVYVVVASGTISALVRSFVRSKPVKELTE